MEIGVYLHEDGTGPLVFVPTFLRPPVSAERLHGPLVLWGCVESDEPMSCADWPPMLARIDDHAFAILDRRVLRFLIRKAMTRAARPKPAGRGPRRARAAPTDDSRRRDVAESGSGT